MVELLSQFYNKTHVNLKVVEDTFFREADWISIYYEPPQNYVYTSSLNLNFPNKNLVNLKNPTQYRYGIMPLRTCAL